MVERMWAFGDSRTGALRGLAEKVLMVVWMCSDELF